jgi:predicted nuclease with TOPRIM domain
MEQKVLFLCFKEKVFLHNCFNNVTTANQKCKENLKKIQNEYDIAFSRLMMKYNKMNDEVEKIKDKIKTCQDYNKVLKGEIAYLQDYNTNLIVVRDDIKYKIAKLPSCN